MPAPWASTPDSSENHTLGIQYTALLLKMLTSLCENFSKGTSCPKVSEQDRCLWCLLQIQPYSSSEGFFLQLYRFPEECLAHQRGKEEQQDGYLSRASCLPSQRSPLWGLSNLLTSWWKPSGFSHYALSSWCNSSTICIIPGKGEQGLRMDSYLES